MVRWVAETPWFSVRLHHWLRSDDTRAHHDHPWDFVTLVVKGRYFDEHSIDPVNAMGLTDVAVVEELRAPCLRYRHAAHRHAVRVVPTEHAWTILLTGPIVRRWGFWERVASGTSRFVKANKWFFKEGPHPCE